MVADVHFDAMSDLCIEAGQAVMSHGSEEMQAAMRVLLAVLGREIALRMSPPRTGRKRFVNGRPTH